MNGVDGGSHGAAWPAEARPLNILVTGARAPISADIARSLKALGHTVFTTDSLRFPVGRFSPASARYIRLPAPGVDFPGFARGLRATCESLNIDLIVPTSEEVFWLAAVEGLPEGTRRLAPSLDVLGALHNKYSFAKLARSLGYGITHNFLLTSQADLGALVGRHDPVDLVLKPAYSRFASQVLISPTTNELEGVNPTPDVPWLAQRRVYGTEVCVYNIAIDGTLVLHKAYLPKLRAGKGASVYFEPVNDESLRSMSEAFVRATNFTGQISFDVMMTKGGLVALECNPRGTSGVHLAAQDLEQFGKALLGTAVPSTTEPHPSMLTLPLLMYNPRVLFTTSGRQLLSSASDSMRCAGVPRTMQALATFEVLVEAVRLGKGALEATTYDIEWNGTAISELSDSVN